jgi:hypothetical protein
VIPKAIKTTEAGEHGLNQLAAEAVLKIPAINTGIFFADAPISGQDQKPGPSSTEVVGGLLPRMEAAGTSL